MRSMRHAFFSVLLLSFGWSLPSTAWAKTPEQVIEQKTQELKQLNLQLNQLEKMIKEEEEKKQTVYSDIKAADLAIAKLTNELKSVDESLSVQRQKLKLLVTEQEHHQAQLETQQQILAEQLKLFYYLGQKAYLNVVLNPQTLQEVNRNLDYYRYLYQAQIKTIDALNFSLERLEQLKQEIFIKTKQLQLFRLDKMQTQKSYRQTKSQRQQLIAKIDSQIKSQAEKAAELKHNSAKLQSVIKDLARQPFPQSTQFKTLKGKLPWPVKGSFIQRFGQTLEGSKIKAHGVTIAAPEDTPVRAIAPGKVLFADWLNGYGLLIIIDHGDNYLSLYGHNDALSVKTDEVVRGGQIIAEVGQSGGQTQNSLYFEIRHRQKPVNPASWCR